MGVHFQVEINAYHAQVGMLLLSNSLYRYIIEAAFHYPTNFGKPETCLAEEKSYDST